MSKLETSHQKYENGGDMVKQLGTLDEARLNSLRAQICKLLKIKDERAEDVDKAKDTSSQSIAGALGWEKPDATDIKKDSEKYRVVLGIIEGLKDISKNIDDAFTDRYYANDYYLSGLKHITYLLHSLGLTLTDIFSDIDPDLENILNIRYFEIMAKMNIEVLENPYAVGVYQPPSEYRQGELILCDSLRSGLGIGVLRGVFQNSKVKFPEGTTPAQANEIFKTNYPEVAALYQRLAKLYLTWRFKRLLLRNAERGKNHDVGNQVNLPVSATIIYSNLDNIVDWLKEVYEFGLKPEDILGMRLEDMFELCTLESGSQWGSSEYPVVKEDFLKNYLDLLQRTSKPDYSIKRDDPILAEKDSEYYYNDQVFALSVLEKEAGYSNRRLFLRAKQPIQWKKLVPVTEPDIKDVDQDFWRKKLNPEKK